jgi:hypothetical protein
MVDEPVLVLDFEDTRILSLVKMKLFITILSSVKFLSFILGFIKYPITTIASTATTIINIIRKATNTSEPMLARKRTPVKAVINMYAISLEGEPSMLYFIRPIKAALS